MQEPATRARTGELRDGQGRRIEYLRLSITDRCNFRCAYCLPAGCRPSAGENALSVAEIGRLVGAFAELGVWKVRLTGGEPALRPDLVEVVRTVAAVPGVRRVALSTNGSRLEELAGELRAAGLGAVNVSVDTLDPARFQRITGTSLLGRVRAGVEAAFAAGIPAVKVNSVLLAGGEDEIDAFLGWTRERPLSVRFIELMQTRDNAEFFRTHHVPAEHVARALQARGWRPIERAREDGPAALYAHPDHLGTAGVIAPYAGGFCASCNRVRVTSSGALRACLFGKREIPLRELLVSEGSRAELVALLAASIWAKPAAHRLRDGISGAAATLAATGG